MNSQTIHDLQITKDIFQAAFTGYQVMRDLTIGNNDTSTIGFVHSWDENGKKYTNLAITRSILNPWGNQCDKLANVYIINTELSWDSMWKILSDTNQRGAAAVFEASCEKPIQDAPRIPKGIPEIMVFKGFELLTKQVLQATRALLDQTHQSITDPLHTASSPQ